MIPRLKLGRFFNSGASYRGLPSHSLSQTTGVHSLHLLVILLYLHSSVTAAFLPHYFLQTARLVPSG
jgi:hypothetical protein